jgi:ribosomal protein S18 acetylase RimI-like enzyme
MESITLRPIRAEDENFLYAVYASTRQEELAPVPWSDSQKAAFLRIQFDAQHQYYQEQYEGAEFQVILRNEHPVGRLYVHRRPDEIRIVDIALLPEHRRAGIGGTLLRQLLDDADCAGMPLTIHVERFNPALHFYERLGFRTIGDTGVYLFMERRPEPPNT